MTFRFTVCGLVLFHGCHGCKRDSSIQINTFYIWRIHCLYITLSNCFHDRALRKSEKLTKQRISNKQNFTHLSETCDWNNYFFSLMNIFSIGMTQANGLHGLFSGFVSWLGCFGAEEFCCIFRFINKFVPNNFWMQN